MIEVFHHSPNERGWSFQIIRKCNLLQINMMRYLKEQVGADNFFTTRIQRINEILDFQGKHKLNLYPIACNLTRLSKYLFDREPVASYA